MPLTQCPVCGSKELEKYLESADHFLSKEIFSLYKCKSCRVLLTKPRPEANAIVNYYKSNDYISHSNESKSLIGIIYKLVRNYTLSQKIRMIECYAAKVKLLDYGCGTGHFLSQAKKQGWEVQGVEPDAMARHNVDPCLANLVQPALSKLPPKTRFNVITLFHVLEHVHDLHETLTHLISLLDKNGLIFLALPNYQSADAQHYQTYWAGYDLPRHLYHFNQHSVFQLAEKYGLKIISIIPMKFDSYYVSMLSEKYAGNTHGFVRGLVHGYKSNRKSRKTKEYSSLIYVLSFNENKIS